MAAGSAIRSSAAFGVAGYRLGSGPAKVLAEMSDQEAKASHDVSLIMDDMHAYFERRRFMRFKTVLDEMRQQDVVGNLRTLGDEVKKENGLSIAAVRVLVRHARPLGGRPRRSGRFGPMQGQVQEQPPPCPGSRGTADSGRRGQPAGRDSRGRAGKASAPGQRF